MNKLVGRVCEAAVVASMVFSTAALAKVTIYMVGDSTMQDWNTGYYPKHGQGQDFQYYFDSGLATVANKGAGGTAAETYYTGNKWSAFIGNVNKGDYIFIQFGINDRNYSNEANYMTYMGKMIAEAQAKGAYPILMNPIRRSDYRGDALDSIYESYHNYPWLTRKLSDSLNVPIIDMDTLSRNYLLSVGRDYALNYVNMVLNAGEYTTYANGNSDNLHLQQMGANAFGRIITEQLRVHPDANVRKLADYLAPVYQLDVKVSPEGADSLTTKSTYFPQGMTVTLKTTPYSNGKKFLGWYDGNGNKITSNTEASVASSNIITFVMGNKSTQYTAVYDGGSAEKYTGNGAALTTFPTCTPKVYGASCGDASATSSSTVASSSSVVVPASSSSYEEEPITYIDTNIVSYFDAYAPDSGNGFSESNHTGFMGEGFFNFANELNSDASYEMIFPSAGYVTMGIRYSFAGTTDRKVNIYLDHDYIVTFKSTGDWDVWDTAYVDIDLSAGEGTLKFISMTSDGGPNIDAFGFSVAGVQRKKADGTVIAGEGETIVAPADTVAKEETITPADTMANVVITPADSFTFLKGSLSFNHSAENAQVSVFNMGGQKVAQFTRSANESLQSLLSAHVKSMGLYRVIIRQGRSKSSMNWVKVQ